MGNYCLRILYKIKIKIKTIHEILIYFGINFKISDKELKKIWLQILKWFIHAKFYLAKLNIPTEKIKIIILLIKSYYNQKVNK